MRGLYWEDWEIGAEYVSPARTVTEADIVMFAGLSGDYNPLHVDEEYCRTTQFGTRIAHGPLSTPSPPASSSSFISTTTR